jgi:ketosteroid isomerase-like protein
MPGLFYFGVMRLLSLIALSAIAVSGQDARQEILAADTSFSKETQARGLDGWMAWFADDAKLNTHKGILSGKAALRQHYSEMFSRRDFSIRWEPTFAETSKDGSLGYTFGSAVSSHTNEKGEKVERQGRYVTVWRRMPDGKWKVATDLGN